MEYLGRYRNLRDQGERFHALLNLPPVERLQIHGKPYQRSRRLGSTELAKLTEAYLTGRSVYDLGREFGIHRRTVAELLRSNGVELRYRKLTDEQITEPERLHEQGWSFVRLGQQYGVDQSTVWSALTRKSRLAITPSP